MKKYTEFLNETNPQIKIIMENGHEMVLELFPECAPITVKNMLSLIDNQFYDNLIFHRVIKDFMIQGGDPTGTGMGGSDETEFGTTTPAITPPSRSKAATAWSCP